MRVLVELIGKTVAIVARSVFLLGRAQRRALRFFSGWLRLWLRFCLRAGLNGMLVA